MWSGCWTIIARDPLGIAEKTTGLDWSRKLWIPDLALFLFFFKKIIVYFWPCWVFVAARGLLAVVSGGYSLAAPHRLLVAVASLVAEALGTRASTVAPHRLSRCTGLAGPQHVGIFLDQGLNPCCLYCKSDDSPLDHQGSPAFFPPINSLFPSCLIYQFSSFLWVSGFHLWIKGVRLDKLIVI